MIDGSEVPGFTGSFWLAYRDQCLPHISHYLSIREEEPLEGGLFVDQKTSQCCFLILQSVSNKIIHHAGVNRDRLTYTEQKYQPQHSVRGCCYDFSKLRQQCMNAGEIRTQDDAVKDTVQMTLMSACEGWSWSVYWCPWPKLRAHGNLNPAHSHESFPQLETEGCLQWGRKQRRSPGYILTHFAACRSHVADTQLLIRSVISHTLLVWWGIKPENVH